MKRQQGVRSQTSSAPHGKPGNVSHYATTQPRLLIDGNPARASWINLENLKAKGAIVLWSEHKDKTIPPDEYKMIAAGAEVGRPLMMNIYRTGQDYPVGWTILRSRSITSSVNTELTTPQNLQ